MQREPAQVHTQTDLAYKHISVPCAKGTAIIFDPLNATIKIVPLTCKSWACKSCSEYLARKLHARVRTAQPNKFITLTVAHEPDLTPAIAEEIIRTRWPRFVAAIRKHRPDFQYLRVLEYQKNGWPHLHLIARCHYIPHDILAAAWNQKVLKGFTGIKAIHNPDAIGSELTKYIRKSFLLNALSGRRRHAYTTSKAFFQDKVAGPLEPLGRDKLLFSTSAPPDELLSFILYALGIGVTFEPGPSSLTITIDEPYRSSAVPQLLKYFASLPWWQRGYNRSVLDNYTRPSPGRDPP